MTIEDVRELLGYSIFNSKGDHIIANCPFCAKEGHFYLNIFKVFQKSGTKYKNCWDCKKCSEAGNLAKLLTKLKKLHLLTEGKFVDLDKPLVNKLKAIEVEEQESLEIPVNKLPIGFRRISSDPYLEGRGFTSREFEKHVLGRTKLKPSLKDYIIISLQERSQCRGYLCRSTLSRQEIDRINAEYEHQGIRKKYLRWTNSLDIQKSKVLIGYDEIMFTTEWVVLTEGFFDKVKVDQVLDLDSSDKIKCCSTLGKAVSSEQIRKLQLRGVTKVIIMQDPDAISESKRLGLTLMDEFEEVLIGYTGSKDLGDSSYKEVLKAFDSLKNPHDFSMSMVRKVKLKP